MREVIPLKQRRWDYAFLAFFFINILFITYIVDFEQLVVRDPSDFKYPVWPLPFFIDMVHWWGNTFDPVLIARPAWWKATIWIDALFFGPFYIFAIYAFIKGKDWIRLPAIIYSSVLMTNVIIIMSEEIWGGHPASSLGIVALANAPWLLFPAFLIIRMWKSPFPFTREKKN
jgi:hypothetical protein